ncbi:hypothetical protein RCL1_002593 [Eukaryota sp. TZLM3-RCL]
MALLQDPKLLAEITNDIHNLREEALSVLTNAFRLNQASFPRVIPFPPELTSQLNNSDNFVQDLDLKCPLLVGLDSVRQSISREKSRHPFFLIRGDPGSGRTTLLKSILPFLLSQPDYSLFPSLPNCLHLPFSKFKPQTDLLSTMTELLSFLSIHSRRYIEINHGEISKNFNQSIASPVRNQKTFLTHATSSVPWIERLNPPTYPLGSYPSPTRSTPPRPPLIDTERSSLVASGLRRPSHDFPLTFEDNNDDKRDFDVSSSTVYSSGLQECSSILVEILKLIQSIQKHTGSLIITIDDFDHVFRRISDRHSVRLIFHAFSYIFNQTSSNVVFALSATWIELIDSIDDISTLLQLSPTIELKLIRPPNSLTQSNLTDLNACLSFIYGKDTTRDLSLIVSNLTASCTVPSIILPIFDRVTSSDYSDDVVNQVIDHHLKDLIFSCQSKLVKLPSFGLDLSIDCLNFHQISWCFETIKLNYSQSSFKNDLIKMSLICRDSNILSSFVEKISICMLYLTMTQVSKSINRFFVDLQSLTVKLQQSFPSLIQNFDKIFQFLIDFNKSDGKTINRTIHDFNWTDIVSLVITSSIKKKRSINFDCLLKEGNGYLQKFSSLISQITSSTELFSSINHLSRFLTVIESCITSEPFINPNCVVKLIPNGNTLTNQNIKSFFIENFKCKILSVVKSEQSFLIVCSNSRTCDLIYRKKALSIKYEKVSVTRPFPEEERLAWSVVFDGENSIKSDTLSLLLSLS